MTSSDEHLQTQRHESWFASCLRWRCPRPAGQDIVPLACLLLAWLFLHRGFFRLVDIPLWDETEYLSAGWRLLHHGASESLLPGSPLYEAWYALVHLLVRDTLAVLYAQWLTVDLLVTVAIYGVTRASGAGVLLAYVVATYWTSLVFAWDVPRVGFFALLLALLAALAERAQRPVRAAILLAAAALARPEYGLALVLWLSIRCWPRLTRRWRRRLLLGVPLVALVALLLAGPSRLGEGRMWTGFAQHYSLRWAARHPEARIEPWSDWGMAVAADFPGVGSVGQALVSHPGKLWAHIAHNLLKYPGLLLGLALSPALPGKVVGPGLLLALLVAMAWSRKPAGPAWGAVSPLLLVSCVSILPSLLVEPKAVYALPVLLVLLFGMARAASAFVPAMRAQHAAVACAALTFALWFAPPRPGRPLPVATTLAELQRVWSRQPSGTTWRMLEADGGWCTYVDPEGCASLWLLRKSAGEGFLDHVRAVDANAVLVSASFRRSARVNGDAEFARFLADPSCLGFRLVFANQDHAFYLKSAKPQAAPAIQGRPVPDP
ncbi:MAG: hypothetical protein JXP73_16185 [Deltaproteobacteria bacterium]|nr:hypothetical protein [Deltaproteobacteria bacterium]